MEEVGSPRIGGIRQIVRLKEILHKWQSVALNSNEQSPRHGSKRTPGAGGISPQVSSRLKNSAGTCDSDDDGCQSPEPPPDVPKGYLAVYVGEELRRFIIPTSYLSHDVFQVLFEKVEEEYGYDHTGALTIPCEIETFKYLIKCIESKQRTQARDSNPQDAATEE